MPSARGHALLIRETTLKCLVATLLSLAAASATAAAPSYRIVDRIRIGGDARWDYIYCDSPRQRLYVSHGSRVEVIDTRTDKPVGAIPDTPGVHGVAIAAELGLGFTSNGRDDSVSVFELATLKVVKTIKVGANPDAILYDPATRRLLTFNGRSQDVSLVDAERGTVVATVPIGGKPEYAQLDANGHAWFDIEDKAELAELDPKAGRLLGRHALAPCSDPTALAIDDRQRLYVGCGNQLMVIAGADGVPVARAPVGAGVDGVAWQDGYAFSANGHDGTVSIVGETAPGRFETVATLPTALGARTIAGDPATHRLYLPTAEFPPAKASEGRRGALPDTFQVLVLERQ
jgi:YVTN family beta-propeller protein